MTRYPVNDSFFSSVDTEPAAYLLGFISADGCVHGNRLIIGAARRDEAHLFKLRALLGAESPVRRCVKQAKQDGRACPASELRVSCARLVDDLARAGVLPAKSLTLEPWKGPAHLLPHYFRGLADGDGSWYLSDGGKRLHFSLAGTRPVVEALIDFAASFAGYRPVPKPGHGRVWDVKFSRRNAVKSLAQALYAGATVWLDRKKAIVDRFLAAPDARPWVPRGALTREQLMALRAEHGTWRRVAASLGMHENTLRPLLRKHGIAPQVCRYY